MNIIDQIKSLPILDCLTAFGFPWKKVGPEYYLVIDNKIDKSFKISLKTNIIKDFGKSGIQGNQIDGIGKLMGIDTKDPDQLKELIEAYCSYFPEIKKYDKQDKDFKFEKSYTDKELLEHFNNHKLFIGGFKNNLYSLFSDRGFNVNENKNALKIGELIKDFGFYDRYYTSETKGGGEKDKPKNVGVLIFPTYDENYNRLGVKLRRIDTKKIRDLKSRGIDTPGLIYDKTTLNPNSGMLYIVEGEWDYLVMRYLGFQNVIGNCGGVMSNSGRIKSLVYNFQNITCLYDNDNAGLNGILKLEEELGRKIYRVKSYPIREDKLGKELSDINDFFKAGYDTKDKMLDIVGMKNLTKDDVFSDEVPKPKYIYLNKILEYYDTEHNIVPQETKLARYMQLSPKELMEQVKCGMIPEYQDVCYQEGGRDGHFNTLDENSYIKKKDIKGIEPILDLELEYLLKNLCGYSDINMQWLEKAILYKITHINDVYLPAVVFYGIGSSGKGTFINLLSKLFGEENTQIGLGQRDLESGYDSYTGNKIIVEFKEVSSGNTFSDKKTTDKLKGMINEDKMHINPKYQPARQVDNIAWFILSSNHSIPIQLDSKHSGNRRFTIIKTGGKLDNKRAKAINDIIIPDKQKILEFVSYLFQKYPEVERMNFFPALHNEEKQRLEDNCESESNLFFEWLEKKYPYITKISNLQREELVIDFCNENGYDVHSPGFKPRVFNSGLSHKYIAKAIRIRGKTTNGYYIEKTEEEKEENKRFLQANPEKKSEITNEIETEAMKNAKWLNS